MDTIIALNTDNGETQINKMSRNSLKKNKCVCVFVICDQG